MRRIYAIAIAGIVVVVALLTLTSIGHTIAMATQHFMLFYAGVLTLIALCASVGLGLVATDRMVLNPGHRVFVQSIHRAASFGAFAFLIIHIVTEILAQRMHILSSFIPFLEPFKRFYIGIGVIAGDLIILLVITSIFRKRFTTNGNAWQWRAIHYSAYASFVLGVWHGLLGGRPGKPYVDWSYGFVVAFVALGLGVRVLSNSLRPKENLSSPAVDERSTGSAPLRAATLSAAAQYGNSRFQALGSGGQDTMARNALTAEVMSTGPASGAMPTLAALPAPVEAGPETDRQPFYEPGYEGPPRFVGAPRPAAAASGPMPSLAAPTPSLESAPPPPRPGTGPMPRAGTGPMPRAGTGPMPRAGTGPMPRAGTGPMPRPGTGPMPRAGTGPMPRPGTGPMPRAGTGPMPRAGTGPMPRPGTGPMPRANSPRAAGSSTGAQPRTEPVARPGAGQRASSPPPNPRRGRGQHRGGPAPRNAPPPPNSWPEEPDRFGSHPYPTNGGDDRR